VATKPLHFQSLYTALQHGYLCEYRISDKTVQVHIYVLRQCLHCSAIFCFVLNSERTSKEMLTFLLLTFGFVVAFVACLGVGRRKEIIDNWEKYRRNPLYLFTAFMYNPHNDPRSRWQFSNDNFSSVMQEYVVATLKTILAPVMMIFQVMGGGLTQSVGGVGKIQNIMAVMFAQFGKITEVFDHRYQSVLHRLAMTFRKIQTTMGRAWGMAAGSMYQSIAVISSILNLSLIHI
jgi:hypothetical protein